MAGHAVTNLLAPEIVSERISRLRLINTTLQNALGFQRGGGNVRAYPARTFSYDVFNDTREVATARNPGSSAGTVAQEPVGTVNVAIPYTAEKKNLLHEELNQLRAIGGPAGAVGPVEQYVTDQSRTLAQRFTNLREFQTAAMLRGSYTYTQTADAFTHGFSGGTVTINYQIPAGNKSQLDMLGAGDIIGTAWDNAASPIVTDLFQINAAFSQLVGIGLTDVWVTSIVWGFILANTQVQAQAGSVNRVFEYIERNPDTEEFTARLGAVPWVTFHVTDNGVNLSGTFTKLIGDTDAVFTTRMYADKARYAVCPYPAGGGNTPIRNVTDEFYWTKDVDDPPRTELHGANSGVPVLLNPSAIAYGTVDF